MKYIIERHSLREVRNQLYKNKFRKFKRELTGQALLLEKSNKAAANELSSRRSNLETRRISLYSRTAGSTMRRPQLPINSPKGQLHGKKWNIPARRQKHTDCFLCKLSVVLFTAQVTMNCLTPWRMARVDYWQLTLKYTLNKYGICSVRRF